MKGQKIYFLLPKGEKDVSIVLRATDKNKGNRHQEYGRLSKDITKINWSGDIKWDKKTMGDKRDLKTGEKPKGGRGV